MRALGLHSTSLAPASVAASSATSSPRSLWHSPVSYLFGGLAAMTGLIAFALLVLACSYCHLARADDDHDDARPRHGDVEQAKSGEGGVHKVSPVFEEKFLVIMAGHELPTFLATPRFSKASLLSPVTGAGKLADGDERRDEIPKEEETEQVNGHDRKSTAETSTQRDQTD